MSRSKGLDALRVGRPFDKIKAGMEDAIARRYVMSDREADGSWIAWVPTVPSAVAYGATLKEARDKALAIAAEATSGGDAP